MLTYLCSTDSTWIKHKSRGYPPVSKGVHFVFCTHQQGNNQDRGASGEKSFKNWHLPFAQQLGTREHGS